MLITISVYATKKLGRFKEAVLIRQKRFQSASHFDLYLSGGRKLTALDDTLAACGVRDQTLLQIAPAAAVQTSKEK